MANCMRLCTRKNILFKFRWKITDNFTLSSKSKFSTRVTCPKNLLPNLGKNALKLSAGILTSVVAVKVAACEQPREKNRLDGLVVDNGDPDFDWNTFYEMLKPFLKELLAAIVAALACAALSIHIPRVLGSIINVVAAHLGNSQGTRTFLEDMKGPAFRMMGLYGLLASCTFIYIHLLSKIGEGVAKTMKIQLFNKLLEQDIAFFDKHRTGDLVNRLTVDVNEFKSSFKMVVSQGLRNVAQIAGCTATLLTISPQMTTVMLVAVPSVILTATLFGSFLRAWSFQAKAQGGCLTQMASEAIGNIRTVRSFAMELVETKMFIQLAEKYRNLNEKLGIGIALFQAGTSLFLNGMVLSTIYVGGRLLADQQIQPGDLMAFLVALQMLQRSFTQISLLFGTYIKGLHAGSRVFEMINMPAGMSITGGLVLPLDNFEPSIEFTNVSFAYPTRLGKNVLDNFTLEIKKGQTVALVGSSGSGKSTIACLLERFYDPREGRILLGGHDLRELNASWLRGRVLGLISQEPVLFATSVRENIRYGRPDATDAEVEEAARMANAEEFIVRFPHGYDTVVGERGAAISGGQKQRIAIARALLKDPAVLILDEATSALDSESEHVVQDALEKIMKGRTTLVIAHRLSTIRNADLIVVLQNGSIAELGTHAKLMKLNGLYASFVQQQQLAGHR